MWKEWKRECIGWVRVLFTGSNNNIKWTYMYECNKIFLDTGKIYLYFYCNFSLNKAASGESFNSLEYKQ